MRLTSKPVGKEIVAIDMPTGSVCCLEKKCGSIYYSVLRIQHFTLMLLFVYMDDALKCLVGSFELRVFVI